MKELSRCNFGFSKNQIAAMILFFGIGAFIAGSIVSTAGSPDTFLIIASVIIGGLIGLATVIEFMAQTDK